MRGIYCRTERFSSRACERGTHGCVIQHGTEPLAFRVPPSNYDTPETQVGYVGDKVMFRGIDVTVDADPGDEDRCPIHVSDALRTFFRRRHG